MGHDMAHGRGLLAGLSVFRPVFCNRIVEADRTALGQHQDGKDGERFADGKHASDAVLPPWVAARRIAVPGPEIHHALAIGPNRDGLADFISGSEVFL